MNQRIIEQINISVMHRGLMYNTYISSSSQLNALCQDKLESTQAIVINYERKRSIVDYLCTGKSPM